MRVCLMIEGQEGVSWDDWLGLAAACEGSGLEGLFRSDHYASVLDDGGAQGSLDCWTTLAGLAARTERIRLGSLVSPATFRHPSVLARSTVTVDHISGGRVELGIGAGWLEVEHRAFGFPFPERSTRLEVFAEQIEIVKRQWTEEPFSFSGRHYTLEDADANPKPLQDPHPPIIVGGAAKRGTVGPAVRFADEYNTVSATPSQCRERRRALDSACRQAGRDPETLPLSLMTTCVVASDRRELRERVRRVMERAGVGGDPEQLREEREDVWVAGTVDEVVERLRELERCGVARVMLRHFDHTDAEMVELLGREVAPAVA